MVLSLPGREVLDRIVAQFVAGNGLPGASVGVVVDDRLAWSTHAGFADVQSGRTADDDTVYRIASITKTFTASAILQLRDAGLLDLEDPIVVHLPEFRAVDNPFGPIEAVTIRRLLRHSSGLQSEPPTLDPRVCASLSSVDVLTMLDRVSITIPPDSAIKYSNLAYHLLGVVVGRVDGRSWADYLQVEILDPMGMTATGIDPEGDPARRARGYRRQHETGAFRAARELGPHDVEGDGALWSSARDLASWMALQFRTDAGLAHGGSQVLAGSTIAEMQQPVVVSEPDLSAAQGLGWKASRRGDTVAIGHGGFIQGFTSRIDFLPGERIGVIVLANGVGHPRPLADLTWELLDAVRTRADRRDPTTARPTATLNHTPVAGHDDGRWNELLGSFVDPEFDNEARVEVDDGSLVFVDLDGPKRHVLRVTDDPLRFVFTSGRQVGEPLLFLRDADGRVDALNVAGYPMVRTTA